MVLAPPVEGDLAFGVAFPAFGSNNGLSGAGCQLLAFVGLRRMDKNIKISMNQTRDF